MIKLKPITDKSWLVLTDALDRIGLLSQQRENYILLTKGNKTKFNSKKEINEFFSTDIFDNLVEESKKEKVTNYIKGYPVDFENPIEPEKEYELPLFLKSATSDVLYGAGYYCLRFPRGWVHAYCPKHSTLMKYEFNGPFQTEKEMKFILAKLKGNK